MSTSIGCVRACVRASKVLIVFNGQERLELRRKLSQLASAKAECDVLMNQLMLSMLGSK
jgi:hypothetical protein